MKNSYQQHFSKVRRASTGKEVAEKLRHGIRQRTKKSESKSRFPWRLVMTSVVGVIIGSLGLQYSSEVENYAHRLEFSLLGIASAEEKKADSPVATPAPLAGAKKAAEEKEPKVQFSEEEINHFTKMNERKRELDAREEELNKMEAELTLQKTELEKRMGELEQTRRNISSVLDDRVKADDKKVDSLVQLYSSMRAQQAAKVFETMDEDLAIEILGRMKKKPAAEILNLVKAEKAQLLSEKYAGYKRK